MADFRGKGKPKGFTMLPEGEQTLHVFDVKAIPRANPSVITMKMLNEEGIGFDKYPQKYDLSSDGGYAAFYYFMLNGYGVDISEDEVDLSIIEDSFVEVEIVHKEGTKPGTKFANIKYTLGPGDSFEVEEAVAVTAGSDDDDD